MVPHITDAIQEWVMRQARVPVDDDDVEPQVCVIEVRRPVRVRVCVRLLAYVFLDPNFLPFQ